MCQDRQARVTTQNLPQACWLRRAMSPRSDWQIAISPCHSTSRGPPSQPAGTRRCTPSGHAPHLPKSPRGLPESPQGRRSHLRGAPGTKRASSLGPIKGSGTGRPKCTEQSAIAVSGKLGSGHAQAEASQALAAAYCYLSICCHRSHDSPRHALPPLPLPLGAGHQAPHTLARHLALGTFLSSCPLHGAGHTCWSNRSQMLLLVSQSSGLRIFFLHAAPKQTSRADWLAALASRPACTRSHPDRNSRWHAPGLVGG